jgi:FtsP/CotA-like multicopper oxidase with cupredoxin domain
VRRTGWASLFVLLIVALLPAGAWGGVSDPCPRPVAGSVVAAPPDLWSRDGVLAVHFDYLTTTDAAGRTLYCFVTRGGLQSPTLHLRPGDTLEVTLTNRVPPAASGTAMAMASTPRLAPECGAAPMTGSSVNLHFHGTNTSPTCHSDEVIHTVVNSDETFRYSLHIPLDEPPGLYWYHPHIHGMSEAAVQGGASGAIVVRGLPRLQPEIDGLPQRVLVIRDDVHPVVLHPDAALRPDGPGKFDLSLNYVPIDFTQPVPGVIRMKEGSRELWRVVNASADSIVDLQVTYDGVAQNLHVVALDGVPVGSQDGTRSGKILTRTDILIPPAGRAEFILKAPKASVQAAILQTLAVDTGPTGDYDRQRPLATIESAAAASGLSATGDGEGPVARQRFEGLAEASVSASRQLYFSEAPSDPQNPESATDFFITEQGATPTVFSPVNPPAIVTTQGSVEDWTIENRSTEVHEFHIHQIHFLLLAVNGAAVPKEERQFYDTYQIPYWTGSGPYPSITVRMDFRGPDVGDFVYHCHILAHEDAGMMAIIRVLPRTGSLDPLPPAPICRPRLG